MVLNITETEVFNMSINKLWKVFNNIKEEIEIDKNVYYTIKYGKFFKCVIHYLINEWYEIYPNSKKVYIRGYGKINLEVFMEELDYRETLLRKVIIDNIDNENIIENRI